MFTDGLDWKSNIIDFSIKYDFHPTPITVVNKDWNWNFSDIFSYSVLYSVLGPIQIQTLSRKYQTNYEIHQLHEGLLVLLFLSVVFTAC